MKNAVNALVLGLTLVAFNPAGAEEPPAEQLKLKDGSTLYLLSLIHISEPTRPY